MLEDTRVTQRRRRGVPFSSVERLGRDDGPMAPPTNLSPGAIRMDVRNPANNCAGNAGSRRARGYFHPRTQPRRSSTASINERVPVRDARRRVQCQGGLRKRDVPGAIGVSAPLKSACLVAHEWRRRFKVRLRGAFSGRLLSGPFHWRIVEFRRVWACHALKEILRDVPIPHYKFGSKSFTVSPEKIQ